MATYTMAATAVQKRDDSQGPDALVSIFDAATG